MSRVERLHSVKRLASRGAAQPVWEGAALSKKEHALVLVGLGLGTLLEWYDFQVSCGGRRLDGHFDHHGAGVTGFVLHRSRISAAVWNPAASSHVLADGWEQLTCGRLVIAVAGAGTRCTACNTASAKLHDFLPQWQLS